MENGFHDADLAGMNIMVSLHNDPIWCSPCRSSIRQHLRDLPAGAKEVTVNETGEVTAGRASTSAPPTTTSDQWARRGAVPAGGQDRTGVPRRECLTRRRG